MQENLLITPDRKTRLIAAVERFSRCRVLVIGDLMLDVFIWGEVSRISPEAPVPVVEVHRETKCLGGAANVAHNLASLGSVPYPAGLIGDDAAGAKILELFSERAVSIAGIVEEEGRPTSVKTRIIARTQQVVRYDHESRRSPDPSSLERLIEFIRETLPRTDVVIISDYAKGVVCARLVEELRTLTSGRIPVVVDPKIQNFDLYRSFTTVTPNHHEAALISGIQIVDEQSLNAAGRKLLRKLGCENLLITRGKEGMSIFRNGGKALHIPTLARHVYDVTGAGDTVAAVLALGTAAGLSITDASILANLAAGIVVGELGTAAVSAGTLVTALEKMAREPRT
ncbi:MAG: D-glycero-beta-D-manno-heptose-7-phosphate kinase [Syntrophobacteraceae bacterium]